MKKLSITIFACLLSICSFSQEHIKFNGATFGQSVNSFVKSFPNRANWVVPLIPSGADANIYNLHDCDISFNSGKWYCKI